MDIIQQILGVDEEEAIKLINEFTDLTFDSAFDISEFIDRLHTSTEEPMDIPGAIREMIDLVINKKYIVEIADQEPWQLGKLLKLDTENKKALFEHGDLLKDVFEVEDNSEVFIELSQFGVVPFFKNRWITEMVLKEQP
jgi:hypothetical protein